MHSIIRLFGAIVLALSVLATSGSSVFAGGSGYKLPYPAGKTYTVTQAWQSGPKPHVSGVNGTTNAVDFGMPEGSKVVAARAGRVVEVVTQFSQCGSDNSFANKNNMIRIAHEPDDGLSDWYVHIKAASVGVGTWVNQGQAIAVSGKVGYTSCGPHLHFHVQNAKGERQYIRFDDAGDVVGGKAYTSGNTGVSNEPPTLTRSRLYVDANNHYLKLEFCGKNIHQTMAVKSWRSGRNFGTQWITPDFGASEGCLTVTNLADGAVLRTATTYYSAVAFTEQDAGVVCHSSKGLCDSVQSKGW